MGSFEGKRQDVFPDWLKDIKTLASLPNTVLKVGGMAMRFTGFEFYKEPRPPSSEELATAWRLYFEPCVKAFSPVR